MALLEGTDGKPNRSNKAVLQPGALLQGYYRRLRKRARQDKRRLAKYAVEVAGA